MSRALPQSPNVEFLRKEAKACLRAHKHEDPGCCAVLRLGFEPSWAQDMEYATDVDEFTQACETLGFEGEWFFDQDYRDAITVIDSKLTARQPAFITGWGDRFGRIVVGRDELKREYRTIGGLSFECGIPMPNAREDERIPLQIDWRDCPSWPTPTGDWFGSVLHPTQVARNPVFTVTKSKFIPMRERICPHTRPCTGDEPRLPYQTDQCRAPSTRDQERPTRTRRLEVFLLAVGVDIRNGQSGVSRLCRPDPVDGKTNLRL